MHSIDRDKWLRQLERIAMLVRSGRMRRFLHTPVSYLLAQILWKILYPITKKGQMVSATTFFGSPMNLVLPSATEIYLFGAKTHDSEIRLCKYLIKNLQEGQVFTDVGAHYGYFSLLASLLTGTEGSVYAFEPSRSAYEILSTNTAQAKNISTFNLAVSDVQSTMTFYEFPVLYSEYNSLNAPDESTDKWINKYPPQLIEVNTQLLDDFFTHEKVNPDLIKIDVEGAELQVLRGMERLLEERNPKIVIEFIAASESHFEALRFANQKGYKCFSINHKGGLDPCPNPDLTLQRCNLNSDNLVLSKTEEAV